MSVQEYPFQTRAKEQALKALEHRRGVQISAKTGYGKTYIVGKIIQDLFEQNRAEPISHFPPFLYLGPLAACEQNSQVFHQEFGFSAEQVFCLPFSQLRTEKYREFFFEKEIYHHGLEERISYNWRKELFPRYVIVDEPQYLRNETSKIHQLCFSLIKESPSTQFINLGYTPAVKPSEMKWMTYSLGAQTVPGAKKSPLVSIKDWPIWIKRTSKGNPDSYNASAMKRVRESLADSWITVKGVKFKHTVTNNQRIISFATEEHRKFYKQAWSDYLGKLRLLKRESVQNQALQRAIALGQLQKRAEAIRAPYLVAYALDSIERGKAPLIVVKYHDTIDLIKHHLKLKGIKASFITGKQTSKEKQQAQKDFQTGEVQCCVITTGAGGTGISLHHNPDNAELTKPRETFLSPAYHAIEIAQAAGRAHRINSISDTQQYLIYFKDTVEEEVAELLEVKLQSMSKLIAKGESWEDLFTPKEEQAQLTHTSTTTTPTDEDLEEFHETEHITKGTLKEQKVTL